MYDSGDSFACLIAAIERPVRFVARNPAAHVAKVRDLESLLQGLAARALQAAETPSQRAQCEAVLRAAAGYESASLAEKSIKIKYLQSILDTQPDVASPARGAAVGSPLPACAPGALSLPLTSLRGVGPRIATLFSRMGYHTLEDLLYGVPRTYRDLRRLSRIAELQPEMPANVAATVRVLRISRGRQGRTMVSMEISDGSGSLSLKWFRMRKPMREQLERDCPVGTRVLVTGVVSRYRMRLEMHHPDIAPAAADAPLRGIEPVYALTDGLHQKTCTAAVHHAFATLAGSIPDFMPPAVCARHRLPDLDQAVRCLHAPPDHAGYQALCTFTSTWHRRLVFDELFLLQLGLALNRRGAQLDPGIAFAVDDQQLAACAAALPFSLTGAQQRVLQEVAADMQRAVPMHRMLQGDVGSGKTVIAFLAARIAHANGYQTALMAPTEILARQHYQTISALAASCGMAVTLLTSGMASAARKEALAALADGTTAVAVGTHALIQDAVEFNRLGLAVVDEQHKFGVRQRASLRGKAAAVDLLVMTATPIPRTLGLTLYGDLDLSVIDELPPGRQPVETRVFGQPQREQVYATIRAAVARGQQAFIVYPLVEESETVDLRDATRMATHLQQDVFADATVGLVHGRMAQDEKEQVMRQFAANAVQILVATTVIEVGIDVPNASVMLIEHAERFGLSQLHQLRGRIGRGNTHSLCMLLADYRQSEDARRRLRVMEETADGFRIAEEDFAIRGPGDFMGTRQSGLPDFRIAHIGRDVKILGEARTAAFDLVEEDPDLRRPEHAALRRELTRRWRGALKLTQAG